MTDEYKRIATAAASLDDHYAALSQHLHEDPVNVEKTDRRQHFSVVEQFAVRWEPYKPDGQRQMKARGRWQRQVWRGDFFRWENCDRPDALFPADFDWRDCATPHYPNRETEAALRAAQAGEGVRAESVDALFADLNDDEPE